MFCKHCSMQMPDNAVFCANCGAPAGGGQSAAAYPYVSPGFSDRINHPSFRQAIKKARKGTGIFAVLLIAAPIIITLVISIKEDDFVYLGIGAAVSLIFLVINLISAAKRSAEKQWDGVVADKQTRSVRSRDRENGGSYYTEYVTVFRDERGKTKKRTEGTPTNDAHLYYDYLNVGDRVRYHPEFGGFFEKYDKSGDAYIYCPVCGSWNAITEDVCGGCGTVLLK